MLSVDAEEFCLVLVGVDGLSARCGSLGLCEDAFAC